MKTNAAIAQSWFDKRWQLMLVGSMAFVGSLLGGGDRVFAQIIPDDTLGTQRSVVTPQNALVNRIDGGVTHGKNLFHSFWEFNVDQERSVYFNSSAGIENILSRITGNNSSHILGILGVVGSNANLFLINPNGIIFGPKALLNVGGSFVATTANAIQFGDQGFFNASAPNVPPILTVNPSAFLFNQIAAAPISNQSTTGLKVREGRSLLLLGGNVQLAGGQLQAPGGRVELVGVAGFGTVGLDVNDNNLRLSFPDGVALADVSLTNGAGVTASGEGGGTIQLSGRRITLTDGSQIVVNTLGVQGGGTLGVNASESVQLIGTSAKGTPSGLFTQVEKGSGAAGDLRISTRRLIVRDGAQVSASTFSDGQGGTLTVNASESVELIGTSANGQVVSGLFTQTEKGSGAAGDLRIETERLIVQDGAQVSASTLGGGQGGTLTVKASESVQLSGTSANSNPGGLFVVTEKGSGTAGDLRIETRRLIVEDGAQVSASNLGSGQGKRGNLAVNASESVELSGTTPNGELRSGLLVGTAGIGAAGDLTVETGQLIVRDGAVVSAGTLSQGRGGTLTVRASDSVQLQGTSADKRFASSLLTQASGTGAAGDLRIETGQLIVRDGANVTVSSEGVGDAGNLEVTARSIELNDRAALYATTKSGNGGDMTLRVQDLLLLRNNSTLSTTAGLAPGGGDGGNIDIDTKFLIAVPSENSDIAANAYTGNGGSVEIAAQGIFGITPRDRPTLRSDITASSERGVSGTIELITPDVDPSQGLVNLPTDVVDASRQIAQSCAGGGGATARKQSEFFITGRGGLPPNPSEAIATDVVWQDLRLPARGTAERSAEPVTREEIGVKPAAVSSSRFVEAQGWVIGSDGRVILTAQAPNVTPHSPGLTSPSCQNELRP